MAKIIIVTVEIYDKTEIEKVEDIISDALNNNGIDCTFDVEEKEE